MLDLRAIGLMLSLVARFLPTNVKKDIEEAMSLLKPHLEISLTGDSATDNPVSISI
jgi:type II secretory pathway component PulF